MEIQQLLEKVFVSLSMYILHCSWIYARTHKSAFMYIVRMYLLSKLDILNKLNPGVSRKISDLPSVSQSQLKMFKTLS